MDGKANLDIPKYIHPLNCKSACVKEEKQTTERID